MFNLVWDFLFSEKKQNKTKQKKTMHFIFNNALYYFHTTLQWFCPISTVTITCAEQRLSPWERI